MIRFCIILGAAKCGTTSLFNYLDQHPEIAGCSDKEPNFFSKYYNQGKDWYLSLWDQKAIDDKLLLEASINYTNAKFVHSSDNMLDFFTPHDTSAKFIYMMRNPIERVQSQYTYSHAHWFNGTLEEALDHGYLIQMSSYASHLDTYYAKFKPENFLLLIFEDFIEKPKETLQKVCRFLDVNASFDFQSLNTVHNPTKNMNAIRPIENIYRRYPTTKKISNWCPKWFKQTLSKILIRQVNEKVKLTDQQQRRVREALKDDMARLQEHYGVNVNKWGFGEPQQ